MVSVISGSDVYTEIVLNFITDWGRHFHFTRFVTAADDRDDRPSPFAFSTDRAVLCRYLNSILYRVDL